MKKLLSAAAIIAALASAVPASAQRTGPGPSANTGTGGVIPPGGYGPSSSLRNLNGGSAGLPGAAPLGRSKSWRRRSRVGLSRLSCCGNSPEDQEPLIREGGAGSPGVASEALSPSAVAVRAPRTARRAKAAAGFRGERREYLNALASVRLLSAVANISAWATRWSTIHCQRRLAGRHWCAF